MGPPKKGGKPKKSPTKQQASPNQDNNPQAQALSSTRSLRPRAPAQPLALQLGTVQTAQVNRPTSQPGPLTIGNTLGTQVTFRDNTWTVREIVDYMFDTNVQGPARLAFFRDLITHLNGNVTASQVAAYQITNELQADSRYIANTAMQNDLRQSLALIRKNAEEGRKAIERRHLLADKLRDWFGDDWFRYYWEPYLTVPMADLFNHAGQWKRIEKWAESFAPGVEGWRQAAMALTERAQAAWARRLMVSGNETAGRGSNHEAAMQPQDVGNALPQVNQANQRATDNMRQDEDGNEVRATSKIISQYYATNEKLAMAKRRKRQPKGLTLDAYGFLHLGNPPHSSLMNSIAARRPVPQPTLGRVEEYQGTTPKKAPKATAQIPSTPQANTGPNPSSANKPLVTATTPSGVGTGGTAFYGADFYEARAAQPSAQPLTPTPLPKGHKRQGSSIGSTMNVTNYQPQVLVDRSRPILRYRDITQPERPISGIQQRVKEALDHLRPQSKSDRMSDVSSVHSTDSRVSERYHFIMPPNPSSLDRRIINWTIQFHNQLQAGNISVLRLPQPAEFREYTQVQINNALSRIGQMAIQIYIEGGTNPQNLNQEQREYWWTLLARFSGMNMSTLDTYDDWEIQIITNINDLQATTQPFELQRQAIEIGQEPAAVENLRQIAVAADFFREDTFLNSHNNLGYMYENEVIQATRFRINERRRADQPSQLVVDGSNITHWYQHRTDPDIHQHLPQLPQQAVDQLFIPMHIPSPDPENSPLAAHWVLMVVDNRTRILHVMNSLREIKVYTQVEQVLAWLQQQYPDAAYCRQDENAQQQDNGSDCGFWVVENARIWAQRGQVARVGSNSTANLRANLMNAMAVAWRRGWDDLQYNQPLQFTGHMAGRSRIGSSRHSPTSRISSSSASNSDSLRKAAVVRSASGNTPVLVIDETNTTSEQPRARSNTLSSSLSRLTTPPSQLGSRSPITLPNRSRPATPHQGPTASTTASTNDQEGIHENEFLGWGEWTTDEQGKREWVPRRPIRSTRYRGGSKP
ncbi:hypothetical protein H2198_001048 [Neophaeococcomyces mojaviensis]|uniref:Uncharacterized protein n=1 Tax=Neophaeococcomyces mojaviensis TaxID=3383035 RepID=A0ACC3AI81_9EURO|nr:hypothetical protein H2198_001048 [Knufia sp. JES_112]